MLNVDTSPKPNAAADGASEVDDPTGALSKAVQSPSSAFISIRSPLLPQSSSSATNAAACALELAPIFFPPSCMTRGRPAEVGATATFGEEIEELYELERTEDGPALLVPFVCPGAESGRSIAAAVDMVLCKSPGTS